ncbi:sensor histidine kinase [Fibrobacterota bacterium]
MDPVKLEMYVRLRWFVKLRWIAILGTVATILVFENILNIRLFGFTLFLVLAAMTAFNFLFRWMLKILPIISFGEGKRFLNAAGFANMQIGIDLIFLTLMWHFYGGIENPIMFFFVFHMIIAAILLPKINSFLWAAFSSLLLVSVAYMEFSGKLDHHPFLFQITGISLWHNLYWNILVLSALCFTLICVVYMTSSISAQLRRRNEKIINLEKEISDKKLQDTEKQLFFSEKMAALGKLAAGMAHEINNPLTTILSYSECLADDLKDQQNIYNDIQTVIHETIRIRKIVRNILDFARTEDQFEVAPINLNNEVLEIIDMLQTRMDFIDVIFNLNLGKDLPPVKVGKEHLTQVIINIMVNASQSMESKGTISINTSYDQKTQMVSLKCADTGPGIPSENLGRVFDPFFTTKAPGEGTGLGLSVSYGLIKMYNGEISVQSKESEGTTFTLILPSEGQAEQA